MAFVDIHFTILCALYACAQREDHFYFSWTDSYMFGHSVLL